MVSPAHVRCGSCQKSSTDGRREGAPGHEPAGASPGALHVLAYAFRAHRVVRMRIDRVLVVMIVVMMMVFVTVVVVMAVIVTVTGRQSAGTCAERVAQFAVGDV